ncbi:5-oxoprolinase subunit PxpB [Simiduia sp. 21SJ11W-1]|uniref:5-oxoprolinase subunit PxpB n=1 Tax=Simiduia sp. 21SJ11W-1 TaxID=2909669 RepID=UPI0020A1F36A|nr:5-oxoprolinase subunit PxpB [Simiduia sp. 21SJ11W-1]UTA47833.1 5-oxoprolinase subunit PxpB [Simiduia sp. 21SJ11W-1]
MSDDKRPLLAIETAGANAMIAYFGAPDAGIDDQAASAVAACASALRAAAPCWLVDMVPSYGSLLVTYNPLEADPLTVRATLKRCAQGEATAGRVSQLVRLPVYYAPEAGPDLEALAERAKLSVAEVVSIHTETLYRVYAIGFAPGFAYLGEVDERIAAPRLATPRTKVPKGAVAIADRQTAVYPAPSPGGWNLIGRCPTPMFDPKAEPTMPVQSGDQVQFYAISREEYLALGGSL